MYVEAVRDAEETEIGSGRRRKKGVKKSHIIGRTAGVGADMIDVDPKYGLNADVQLLQ